MASKVKSLDIAEIASKVLILPTETRPKKPSKRLLLEIKGFVTDFSKTKERANRVIELGIKEGFTDSEIGKLVRQAMKKAGYSKMTIWRALPQTARQQQNHRQKVNRMLTFPYTSQEKQPQQPGRWNIDPEDYDINKLHEYDKDLLIIIVEWLHNESQKLRTEIKSLRTK